MVRSLKVKPSCRVKDVDLVAGELDVQLVAGLWTRGGFGFDAGIHATLGDSQLDNDV